MQNKSGRPARLPARLMPVRRVSFRRGRSTLALAGRGGYSIIIRFLLFFNYNSFVCCRCKKNYEKVFLGGYDNKVIADPAGSIIYISVFKPVGWGVKSVIIFQKIKKTHQ